MDTQVTMRLPEPSYADVNGDAIAWYSIGDGPETLVGTPGMFTGVESIVESPKAVRLIERLASIRRVVLFDHRTTGLSDSFSDERDPTVADWVDDLAAVLQATGRQSVDLFGLSTSVPGVIAAAAAMPDRIRSLVLISGCPKLLRDPGYPEGMAPDVFNGWRNAVWGVVGAADVERDLIGLSDESDRTFMRRAGQRGARPRAARRLLDALAVADVREELTQVRCPTLIVHADDDPLIPSAVAHLMANSIKSSQLEILASDEHVLALAMPDEIADLAETFLTGRSVEPVIERELLAVLCTDIVDSTTRATAVGDVEWRRIIGELDVATRDLVERGRGTVVKFTGDGHLATFDRPGDAIRASCEVTEIAEALGIPIRAGIHFGEVEILDGDVLGVAVVIATRVMGLGGAGETITTSTVVDLVEGAEHEWESIGSRDLKGINRSRELWSLRRPR